MHIHKDWHDILKEEFNKAYWLHLEKKLLDAYANNKVYPPKELLFSALNNCLFKNIKVVILGQDPYHQPNQANGLCFSVSATQPNPPSLRNILKEVQHDTQSLQVKNGDLEDWAHQGVLLLNTTLTVEESRPLSHQNIGWEFFTNEIIRKISEKHENVVFMLWGKHAESKETLIASDKHLLLKSSHPSPLSAHRGFLGCKHFSTCNQYLTNHNKTPIAW